MKALTFPTPSTIPVPSRWQSKSPTPAFEIENDMEKFLSMLSKCETKPVVLSLIEPYASDYVCAQNSKQSFACLPFNFIQTQNTFCLIIMSYWKFVPKTVNSDSPFCLSQARVPNYHELLKVCEECVNTVSDCEAESLEASIRHQSDSSLWFSMRTERITASRFKAVSHTDWLSPSINLIMSICHPELTKLI